MAELGLELAASDQDALIALAVLLTRWSERMNLTAHRTPESIVRRLILDAASLEQALPQASRIVDLGSGAGFPGLPLAVLRPVSEVLLVEAREKRHHFQRAAIRELGLSNARPIRGRAESVPPRRASLVVAQAVAAPDRALSLALEWVEPGGWIGIPGSQTSDGPRLRPPKIIEVRRLEYQVPLGGPARTLWLGRAAAL